MAYVQDRWKLIDVAGTLELYNVHEDPDELSNLVDTHPAIVHELRTLLEHKKKAALDSPFD